MELAYIVTLVLIWYYVSEFAPIVKQFFKSKDSTPKPDIDLSSYQFYQSYQPKDSTPFDLSLPKITSNQFMPAQEKADYLRSPMWRHKRKLVFERDGNKAEVLMTLRMAVMLASNDEVKNLLTLTDHTNTFSERRLKVQAGQLKFWKDLVFCNDLI